MDTRGNDFEPTHQGRTDKRASGPHFRLSGSRQVTLSKQVLSFPERCIRCGKEARFEARIRRQVGIGVILRAMISVFSFSAIRGGDFVEVAVPVCWLCREWHSLARLAGLLIAIALVSLVLFGAFWFSYAIIPSTGVGPYILIVIGFVLLILWFSGTRGIALVDRLILNVRIVSFSAGDVVTLRFKDAGLAQEVAQSAAELRKQQLEHWLPD